jgi:hypothetical protein
MHKNIAVSGIIKVKITVFKQAFYGNILTFYLVVGFYVKKWLFVHSKGQYTDCSTEQNNTRTNLREE